MGTINRIKRHADETILMYNWFGVLNCRKDESTGMINVLMAEDEFYRLSVENRIKTKTEYETRYFIDDGYKFYTLI